MNAVTLGPDRAARGGRLRLAHRHAGGDWHGGRVACHKMWLGGAGPERFTPGGEPALLEIDGWRLGLAICKDTGVPRHASDTAALGIDAYVADVLAHAHDAAMPGARASPASTRYG